MSTVLFAQIAGAGPAILISCCLAALGIIGFFFVCYFSHCFLTVLVDSAAGIDEIRWPPEWITDWLTKPLYLLWILMPLVVAPSILLVATGSGLTFAISMLVLLWAVAPVMFLSSLAAKSWMSLLYGPFLRRWARFLFAYVIFLIWSGVLIGLGAGMMVWALLRLEGVALATLFLPPVFLLYWRVFGRYAWYVTTRRMRKAKKKKLNPAKGLEIERFDPWSVPEGEQTESTHEKIEPTDNAEIAERIRAADTREKFTPAQQRDKLADGDERDKVMATDQIGLIPLVEEQTAVDEDEWTPNKKPYGVMTEAAAKQSWQERKGQEAHDTDGYDVEHLSIGPPVSLWQYYTDRAKKEEELREQGKSVRQFEKPRKPPTLAQAMTREIFGFLLYPHTIRAWLSLSIGFLLVLLLLNVIITMTKMIGVA
jgi:signal transduction histidine kinase